MKGIGMQIESIASTTPSLRQQLRPVAQEWVAQTFFGTLLKQARTGSLGPQDSPLSGGRGGEAFSGLFDQHMARSAAGGVGGRLVDSIVDRIAGKPQPAPAPLDIAA